jgi:hypothetical protein
MISRNVSANNPGGIRITHKEFIQDVVSSNAFTVSPFPINPGLPLLFPWLSQIADAYEEYRIHAMVFQFKSLASDTNINPAGGSSTLGTVMMGTNYNANRQPFVNKRAMDNYEGTTSRKPNSSFTELLNVKKIQTPLKTLWLRNTPLLPNEDGRLYDIAVFNIATSGMPAANDGQTLGELWVAYDIEFFKPKYSGAIGTQLLWDHYITKGAANINETQPFGVLGVGQTTTPNALNGAGTYLTRTGAGTGANTINWTAEHQDMSFMVLYILKGTGVQNIETLLSTAATNMVTQNFLFNQASGIAVQTSGAGGLGNLADIIFGCLTVKVNAGTGPWNWRFTLGGGGANRPGDPQTMDLFVGQMNGSPEAGPF